LWYFVVFLLEFGTVLSVWYLLFFMDVGTVLTVWYFVIFHGCWNCSDSVVFCCFSIRTVLTVCYYVIFLFDFGTVLTGILLFFMDVGTVLRVWYFVIFLLELSWQCGILLFFY
jgi:hypothetical protein